MQPGAELAPGTPFALHSLACNLLEQADTHDAEHHKDDDRPYQAEQVAGIGLQPGQAGCDSSVKRSMSASRQHEASSSKGRNNSSFGLGSVEAQSLSTFQGGNDFGFHGFYSRWKKGLNMVGKLAKRFDRFASYPAEPVGRNERGYEFYGGHESRPEITPRA